MRAARCYRRGQLQNLHGMPTWGRAVRYGSGGKDEVGVPLTGEGGLLTANDGRPTAPMRAVVLAGGLGTRLRPYTTVIPKPLVPIGDRPVLEHIIRTLGKCGVDRVDLCVSHLGELILVYLANADLPPELQLAFHWEREPLGTAGALSAIDDLEGTFIAMNGDVLTNLDYRELVEYHREREAALTVAMRSQRVNLDLGVISSDDGFVQDFIEKPALNYQVSMGVYVYDERALRFLPEGPCQFPDLVLRLLDAGERVAAFESHADWFDIGTMGEYERAAADVERFPQKYDLEPVGPQQPGFLATLETPDT
jgi:NDP-sugar pyrophosphorylase family protein